jgi:hypothetical protein
LSIVDSDLLDKGSHALAKLEGSRVIQRSASFADRSSTARWVAASRPGGALGGALTGFGINDKFMKDLAESIHPGDAVLFVLIREMTADKVLKQIKDYGGVVLKTSLTDAREQALRDGLASAAPAEATPTGPSASVSS